MFSTVYVEREVASHPRTREILARLPRADQVECGHYGEIFNLKSQNFRLQKRNPALILAHKRGRLVNDAPAGHGIGAGRNFYFSHLLNCPYDCRYCFLQGMFRSANFVLFVNYEDFADAVRAQAGSTASPPCVFFSGYDCDSLALEPISGFVRFILPVFNELDGSSLELRTKSTRIRPLLESEPLNNCVVAFSLTPDRIARASERGAPPVAARLRAMRTLQDRGWSVGLRFDPVIYTEDYRPMYRDLFHSVFGCLDSRRLHSVTLGSFRLPRPYFRTMAALYPDHRLFAAPLREYDGVVTYPDDLRGDMIRFCRQELAGYVPAERLFVNGKPHHT